MRDRQGETVLVVWNHETNPWAVNMFAPRGNLEIKTQMRLHRIAWSDQ